MGALIVVDVHARDVVTTLMKNRVDNLNDFDWTCQLRYYWEKVPEEEGISDVYAK
jgi:dynein heavy chain